MDARSDSQRGEVGKLLLSAEREIYSGDETSSAAQLIVISESKRGFDSAVLLNLFIRGPTYRV